MSKIFDITVTSPHYQPITTIYMQKISTTEDMKTLSGRLNKLVLSGYTDDFKATELGLLSLKSERKYPPEEIHVVDFHRFEGASDPADNSILYVIETSDGIKGTLIDAYGPYADPNVSKFMKQVEDITKKTGQNDTKSNR
jgi:hypothetical protein